MVIHSGVKVYFEVAFLFSYAAKILVKVVFKMADQKKALFPALPILDIFLQKFHGLIDLKGIGVAQPIW